jgi:hypothetical protein
MILPAAPRREIFAGLLLAQYQSYRTYWLIRRVSAIVHPLPVALNMPVPVFVIARQEHCPRADGRGLRWALNWELQLSRYLRGPGFYAVCNGVVKWIAAWRGGRARPK